MNIFYDFNDSQVVTVEELPWTGNLKAGTPVDESGAVANDATAIGILAEDVSLPFGRKIAADRRYFVNAKVVKGGFIDKARAEVHCGITYADSLIEALTDIHFVDAFDPEFPGSGGSGSGLPDPSTLTDGTAMVAVDGEWKMQEGYGYTGEPAFEPITWDGNTEGRDTLTRNGNPFAYKVSDTILTDEMLSGASSTGSTGNIGGVEVSDSTTSFLMAYSLAEEGATIISGAAGEYSEMVGAIVIPSNGTYFTYFDGSYITSLTSPSVHQFDPALIPASGGGKETMIVTVTKVGEEWVADKTLEELFEAAPNVICNLLVDNSKPDLSTFLPLHNKNGREIFKSVTFSRFDCYEEEGILVFESVNINSVDGTTVNVKGFELTPIEDV